jgi:hypothetical protein
LPVSISDRHLAAQFDLWRNHARAAIGILATCLDERVAQEELFDDLILLSPDGSQPELFIDTRRVVREFLPTSVVTESHRRTLAGLASIDICADDPRLAASRYYLQGAQNGPTINGVIALICAVEALVQGNFSVNKIEAAVEVIGYDVSTLQPSMRKLNKLRTDILHHGIEQPRNLVPGYYALEQLARSLIRAQLDVGPDVWPLAPESDEDIIQPVRQVLRWLRKRPKESMRRIDGGPPLAGSS